MRIAYINCFAGIAGDMTVAALLDAGLDINHLRSELGKLGLDGYRVDAHKTQRHGISATRFEVFLQDEDGERVADTPHGEHEHSHGHDHDHDHPHEHEHEHSHEHGHEDAHGHDIGHTHFHTHARGHEVGALTQPRAHAWPRTTATTMSTNTAIEHSHGHEQPHDHEHEHGHEHSHGHEQPHDHEHEHGHSHTHSHTHAHRSFAEIRDIIAASALSDRVKRESTAIFTRLAEAEGKMHDKPPEEVHFHEVGSLDAIVDIVGTCIGLEALGVDEVYASAVRVGTGTVKAAHGVLPVPAPATVELLRGVPVHHTEIPFEMTTPTGAAIVTALAKGYGSAPAMTPENIGYGAGGSGTRITSPTWCVWRSEPQCQTRRRRKRSFCWRRTSTA